MKGMLITWRPPMRAMIFASINLGSGLAALLLSVSNLHGESGASSRLIRCGRNEAETTLTLEYQLPGSSPMGNSVYAKTFQAGDEKRPVMGASTATDMMGNQTTTLIEFMETEVAFTITQVPGPDRLNPYKIVIHGPFRQNLTGTIDGTQYSVNWEPVAAGGSHRPNAGAGKPQLDFAKGGMGGPVINSVNLSPSELMMFPHDPRLEFDILPDSVSGSGDWIRLRAKNPTGEVAQVLRIQTMNDPGGILGTDDVAEAEVKAVCAPYLRGSLDESGAVQTLKRDSGNVYYCLLSNAAFANNPTPPEAQFRYLFLGVFRISSSVAVVVGNLSQKDDVNYRLMLEALGKISTLPIVTGSNLPAAPGKKVELK